MKFTLIVILALVACSFALRPKKVTPATQAKFAEIKKGKSWASIILNLAELHLRAKGPVQELEQAIEDTIVDLQFKRTKKDEAYVKRTNQHNALVTQLTADIANAEADIVSLEELLEVLAQQKAELEAENALMVQINAQTEQSVVEATAVREAEHEAYQAKVVEFNEAVATVDECITILDEFETDAISFAQVTSAKKAMAKAQAKLEKVHNKEAPFLKALVQVAVGQEFADASAIRQVINKFTEIRNNLLDGLNGIGADENLAQQQFEAFLADCAETIHNNNATIEFNNGLLVENAANTAENQEILANRRAELAEFQQALADEHESFKRATEVYENFCAENDREIAVCGEALEVLATFDAADYISERIDAEDGLVSSGMATAKPHGQGTEVFNFDYDQF